MHTITQALARAEARVHVLEAEVCCVHCGHRRGTHHEGAAPCYHGRTKDMSPEAGSYCMCPGFQSAMNYDSATGGVLVDIVAERQHQDARWGGAAHDDLHYVDHWATFREHYERRAMGAVDLDTRRAMVVKIAALAVAQLEALDRGVFG